MLNKKIIISIIISIVVVISARNIFAQGLDIGGSVSFSYINSDGTGKAQTLEDQGENFSHNYNYSLNVKTDLTSKGSARSAIRYAIGTNISSKTEATDFTVELSYDIISTSLGLTENTNSDYNLGVTNSKSTSFGLRLNPKVLPKVSFSYSTSVNNEQISANASNAMNVSFSKNFNIQSSNLSTAVSYSDNGDTLNGKQNTNNVYNVNYGINLMNNKLSINTGYRVGNNYNVNTTVNTLSEAGNLNLSFRILDNLNFGGDWAKNSNFSSESATRDVNNNNSFRLNYVPIKDLSFTLGAAFNENQTRAQLNKSSSKNFITRFPTILEVATIAYNYNTNETENTLSAENSIDFALDFGALQVENFTSNVRYGTKKSKNINADLYSTFGNFNFGASIMLIENLNLSYTFNLDKITSVIEEDNREASSNAMSANYSIKLMEDLNCSMGTSYTNTNDMTPFSSGSSTSQTYDGSINYSMGKTVVNIAGSVSYTFDVTGVHISQRTSVTPGILTNFMGTIIAANASFGEDTSDGALTSNNSANYSLTASYPLGTIGTSSFTYTVSSLENINDPTGNKDDESIAFNASLNF